MFLRSVGIYLRFYTASKFRRNVIVTAVITSNLTLENQCEADHSLRYSPPPPPKSKILSVCPQTTQSAVLSSGITTVFARV
jgi:hypothetical protein